MSLTPPTPPTPIEDWPTPTPVRTQPQDVFRPAADAWQLAFPSRTAGFNALAANVNANAGVAFDSAEEAILSAQIALAAENAAKAIADADVWVSGQAYALGSASISPIDFQTYRARVNTSGVVDPSNSPDWKKITIGFVPAVGDFLKVAAQEVPAQYLLADGSVYLQSAYPVLFDVIGKIHKPVLSTTVTSIGVGNLQSVAFARDDVYAVVGGSSATSIAFLKRSGDTFTKLSDAASMPTNQSFGVAFSNVTSEYVAVASNDATMLRVYKRSGDTFTKLTDPGSVPASGSGYSVEFSFDDVYLAAGYSATPFLTIHKRSGDTFTKLSDPAILPAGQCNAVSWTRDGVYLACAHATTPFLTIYKRNGDTFTKLANPSVLPASTGNGVAFSPDGKFLAVGHNTLPRLTLYERNGDTFIKLNAPTLTSDGRGVAYSEDGNYLFVGMDSNPFINIFRVEGSKLYRVTNPTTLTAGAARVGAYSKSSDTRLAIASTASADLRVWKNFTFDSATEFAVPTVAQDGNTPEYTFIKAEE